MIISIFIICATILLIGGYSVMHLAKILKKDREFFTNCIVSKKGSPISFKDEFNKVELPLIRLTMGGEKYYFLLDSGANINVVTTSLYNKLLSKNIIVPKVTTTGTLITTTDESQGMPYVDIDFKYNNKVFKEEFMVIDMDNRFSSATKECKHIDIKGILGNNFFSKYKWELDFNKMVVWTK